jgi:hypothetical protein
LIVALRHANIGDCLKRIGRKESDAGIVIRPDKLQDTTFVAVKSEGLINGVDQGVKKRKKAK